MINFLIEIVPFFLVASKILLFVISFSIENCKFIISKMKLNLLSILILLILILLLLSFMSFENWLKMFKILSMIFKISLNIKILKISVFNLFHNNLNLFKKNH